MNATNELLHLVKQPMDQNPAYVYLASLNSPEGRRTQAHVLNVISAWLGGTMESINWGSVRYQHCTMIRTKAIEHGYSASMVQKILAALRGVVKHAWRLGLMSAEDYQKASDLPPVKNEKLPSGRYIDHDEINGMVGACLAEGGVGGVRDATIIAVLYFAAMRRHELVDLELKDYDRETGKLIIHGKGNKERIAYITNGAKDAMDDWLQLRGDFPGALFTAVKKAGGVRCRDHLTAQAIYAMLQVRAKQAGIEKISPHDFRRTGISDLLAANNDLSIVSKIVGHSNPQTTSRYDRRPDNAKQEAAGSLHIRYKRKEQMDEATILEESE